MIFFIADRYTAKEHVFPDPNTFPDSRKKFSSNLIILNIQLILIQRWTFLIHRKPALISAGFFNLLWNNADQRCNLYLMKSLKKRCSVLICFGISTWFLMFQKRENSRGSFQRKDDLEIGLDKRKSHENDCNFYYLTELEMYLKTSRSFI